MGEIFKRVILPMICVALEIYQVWLDVSLHEELLEIYCESQRLIGSRYSVQYNSLTAIDNTCRVLMN
jgi:hypothetical protein